MAVAIKPQYVYMWPHKALEDYHLVDLLRGSTSPQRKEIVHFSLFNFVWAEGRQRKGLFLQVFTVELSKLCTLTRDLVSRRFSSFFF